MPADASSPRLGVDEPPDEVPRRGAEAAAEIVLQNPCRYPEAGALQHRSWLEALVLDLAPDAEGLGIRFVSDREMRRLNATYRDKDRPTDVLSFPGEDGYLGDIAISVPTARRQAEERGWEVRREIRVLLLHGVLHCLGYDHEVDDGEMERLEAELRQQWIL